MRKEDLPYLVYPTPDSIGIIAIEDQSGLDISLYGNGPFQSAGEFRQVRYPVTTQIINIKAPLQLYETLSIVY